MTLQQKPLDDERLTAIGLRLSRITKPRWEFQQPYVSLDIYTVPRSERAAYATPPHAAAARAGRS